MKIVVVEDVVSAGFDKRFFVDEKVVFLHLQW
jgi:orotate phosphoribosyltransferase